jgi:hypothetical protein
VPNKSSLLGVPEAGAVQAIVPGPAFFCMYVVPHSTGYVFILVVYIYAYIGNQY